MYKKLSLAVAISAAIGLQGCHLVEGDKSSSRTGGTSEQVQAKASVSGIITDVQGTAIADATVTIQGKTIKTDHAGAFKIDGLQVSSVYDANRSLYSSTVAVKVNGPKKEDGTDAYLGALVTASLSSVVHDSKTEADGTVTNPNSLLQDGFIKDLGQIRLPARNVKVKGQVYTKGANGSEQRGATQLELFNASRTLDVADPADLTVTTNETATALIRNVRENVRVEYDEFFIGSKDIVMQDNGTFVVSNVPAYPFVGIRSSMGRVAQIDNTVNSTTFEAATTTTPADTASLNLYNKVESYLSKVLVEYTVARDTENPFIVTVNQLKTLVEDGQNRSINLDEKDYSEIVVEFSEVLKETNLHVNPESALNSDVILVANRIPLEISAKWGTKPTLNGSFSVTTLTINIKDSVRKQLNELVREDQEVRLDLYLMKNKFVDLSNRELAARDETVLTTAGVATTENLGLANDVAVAPTGTVGTADTNANDRYILIPMVTESDRAVASKQLDAEQVFALEEGTNNIVNNSFAPNALKDLSELVSLQNLNSDQKEVRVREAAAAVRLGNANGISTDTARIRIQHLDGATGYLIRVKPAGQLANFLPFAQVDNGTNGFVANDTRIQVRRLQDNRQVLVDGYRTVGRDGSLTAVTATTVTAFADLANVNPPISANGVLVAPVAGQDHIDLTLENVAVGQEVHIIPQGVEDFGTGVANKVVVLQDKVAPMHLLQTAYGVGENTAALNTNPAVASFARDGELFQQGEEAETDRLALPIQPRHLGVGTGTQLPARTGDVQRTTEVTDANFESVQRQYSLHGLTEASVTTGNDLSLVESRASAAYTKPQTSPANNQVPTEIRHNLYTAEGFAAWNQTQGGAKQIGIGFSEDIKFAGENRPELQLADGTASTNLDDYQLSWAIRNDNRFADDNAENVNADNDYLLMTASKLADFANNQHGQWLAFGESIQDEHGNAADKDNRLMVRDLMPPLVTAATLTNDGLRVTFNEPVRYARLTSPLANIGQRVRLGNQNIDLLTQANAVGEGANADGLATEFLIPMNRVEGLNLNVADRIVVETNPVIRNANEQHTYFELNFDNVQDARGNRWAQYNVTNTNTNTGTDVDAAGAAGWFMSPNFLFVNRVNELDVNLNNPRVTAGSTELSFTLTTNAPLGTTNAPLGTTTSSGDGVRPSFLNAQDGLIQGNTACGDFNISKNNAVLTPVTDFDNCRVVRNPGPGISYTFTVELAEAAAAGNTFNVNVDSSLRYFTNLPLIWAVGEVQEEMNQTTVN